MTRILAAGLIAMAAWWAVPPRRVVRAEVLIDTALIDTALMDTALMDTALIDAARPDRAAAWWTWLRARRRLGIGPASRRRQAGDRLRTVQALGALAAELESGQPPLSALEGAGDDPSIWPTAIAAARAGDDVVSALEVDAVVRPPLAQLAACWRVSASTGTGFALAVQRLAASVRQAEDVRVELEAELAGPRATARMLVLLPLVGVGFGLMMGSDPLAWLLGTPLGLMCLTVGAGLSAVGTMWTGRIAASVERLL